MKIGWIGLGQMGRAMAARCVADGHTVTAHVRTLDGREAARGAGIALTQNMREAVENQDVIGVALFDDQQLLEIGRTGVFQYIKADAVAAVHVTGSPRALDEFAQMTSKPNSVLDATFSGTSATLDSGGRITLMVGGSAETLARAQPVLSAYCDPIAHLGALGAGRKLKLINNVLFAGQVALSAEALELAASMGLDQKAAADVLGKSSGASFALSVVAGGESPSAILTRLSRYLDKDVAAARAAAQDVGLDFNLLAATTARWGVD
ncbi:MAG: NAD(P)-binding domain-containing protein [Caulobacterales bacterium]